MIRAVDAVQKHTEKHILTEYHLRKAVQILEAFRVYSENVCVTVIADCIPEWFKYPVPCTVLVLSPKGGTVRRSPAPVYQQGTRFHKYRVTVFPLPACKMPFNIGLCERVADTERWES